MKRNLVVFIVVADLLAVVYFAGLVFAGDFFGKNTDNDRIVVALDKIDKIEAPSSPTPTPNTIAVVAPTPSALKTATPASATPAPAPIAPAPAFNLATYTPNLANGAKVSAKCKACHTFDAGGKNRIGPNLWGIFNKDVASTEGVKYSPALKNLTGTWNDDALDAFLKSPRAYAKGTKMAFPGIKKPEQRADLIAWLKTLK